MLEPYRVITMFIVAVPLLDEDTGGVPGAEMTLPVATGALAAWAGVSVEDGPGATVATLPRTLHRASTVNRWPG